MGLYDTVVRTTAVILNLVCILVVPIVERIAHKVRIGSECGCPHHTSGHIFQESTEAHENKRKKIKSNESVNKHKGSFSITGGGGKRIKLLLDITVRQVGPQSVDIQEETRYVVEDDRRQEGLIKSYVKCLLGIIITMFNLPSSIALYGTSKLRKWAHDLGRMAKRVCEGDPTRIKKSPRRRFTSSNYKSFIPFFPFNLLGFSNYTPFQMPNITNPFVPEENNLNISAIVSGRVKRPRRSSEDTGEDGGSGSSKMCDLDVSEIACQPQSIGGHDEVDSDESGAEVETRPISTSASSNFECNEQKPTSSKTDEMTKLDINIASSDVSEISDADSKRAVAGDEIAMSSFLQELEEAANESYNSALDPEYMPDEANASSSGTTSYESGSGASVDNSYNDQSSTNSPNKYGEVKGIGEENKNGDEGKSTQRANSPLYFKQEATSTAGEEDYKTPEEEEHM